MGLTSDFLAGPSPDWLAAFTLVLGRLAGVLGLAPVFGSIAVPVSVRAALAAALAMLVAPSQRGELELPAASVDFVVLLVREIAVGAVIGVGMGALIAGVRGAGQLAEQQTGLALSELFDPQLGHNEPALERFYAVFALTVFLVIGGHHMVLGTLLESFEAVPVGRSALPASAVGMLTTLVGQSFQIALRVAAPLVVTLLLAGVAVGYLARTAPQLELLVIALPLRVLVGLFALAIAMVGVGALVSEQTVLYVDALQQATSDARALPPQP